MPHFTTLSLATLASMTLVISGCGHGNSSNAPTTYSLGGTVSGVTDNGLVLANGRGDGGAHQHTGCPGGTTFFRCRRRA
jgi:hypothetical protein